MRIPSTSAWKNSVVELFVLDFTDVTNAYVGWLNDPVVSRYLESRFTAHTVSSTLKFVENCLESSSSLLLGIKAVSVGGRHIGNVKIGPIDPHHGRGEIGILIGDKEAWGQGIATEALQLAINISLNELGLRKLTAGCYHGNIGSKKAFVKAGFKIVAERPAHFLLDGQPEGIVLMDCILK